MLPLRRKGTQPIVIKREGAEQHRRKEAWIDRCWLAATGASRPGSSSPARHSRVRRSIDDLVCSGEKGRRHLESKGFRSAQIHREKKRVGCSIGRLAGFVPFSILSTYEAARR